jgi:microcystin synthetase protein McyA
LPELFAQPTVRGLAQLALNHTAEGPLQPTAPRQLLDEQDAAQLPDHVTDAYPLIELQAGMLFHAAYSPETAVYHDVFGCRVGAALDQDALRAALETLARRHDALRTRFALSGFSKPLQLVEQQTTIPLFVHDLIDLDEPARQEALQQFNEQEKQHRFDWNTAPLLRLHAHQLTQDSFYLTLSFHHAILDGWSVATLLAELFTLYTSNAPQSPASLAPPPRLAYRDFVALEQNALDDQQVQDF